MSFPFSPSLLFIHGVLYSSAMWNYVHIKIMGLGSRILVGPEVGKGTAWCSSGWNLEGIIIKDEVEKIGKKDHVWGNQHLCFLPRCLQSLVRLE